MVGTNLCRLALSQVFNVCGVVNAIVLDPRHALWMTEDA